MERLVLASHGSLASGMKSALQMITGDISQIVAYDLDMYGTPEKIFKELKEEIKTNNHDKFIIITDLLGGSVHIHLMPLCEYKNVFLVSGMNLGLVLEIVLGYEDNVLSKVEHAVKSCTTGIKVFTNEKVGKLLTEEEEVFGE